MNVKYDEISLLFAAVIGVATGFAWGYSRGHKSAQENYKRVLEERVKFLEDAGYDSIPRHFPKQKGDVEKDDKANRLQKNTPPTGNSEN